MAKSSTDVLSSHVEQECLLISRCRSQLQKTSFHSSWTFTFLHVRVSGGAQGEGCPLDHHPRWKSDPPKTYIHISWRLTPSHPSQHSSQRRYSNDNLCNNVSQLHAMRDRRTCPDTVREIIRSHCRRLPSNHKTRPLLLQLLRSLGGFTFPNLPRYPASAVSTI